MVHSCPVLANLAFPNLTDRVFGSYPHCVVSVSYGKPEYFTTVTAIRVSTEVPQTNEPRTYSGTPYSMQLEPHQHCTQAVHKCSPFPRPGQGKAKWAERRKLMGESVAVRPNKTTPSCPKPTVFGGP